MERAVRDSETIQRDPANASASAPALAMLKKAHLGRTHALGLTGFARAPAEPRKRWLGGGIWGALGLGTWGLVRPESCC